jgi:acyl-CoA synthetase (AMP-forming)/AMP-acid ligase II
MLTHANVLHHCRDLRAGCGYGPDSVSVTWLPYFHDYGLIEGVITPVQNGTPCHIMSPFSFLKRPFAWLYAMSRLGGTHTQGPNFAYDQCIRRIRPDQRAGLDLSHVVSMGNGAEPVNPAVVEAFHTAFAEAGLKREALCPAYGLAEATLMMSCRGPDKAPRYGRFDAAALTDRKVVPVESEGDRSRLITSCGAPLGSIEIAIVDPDTKRRCAPDEIGEVWISDPCVAVGYWRRPEATEETFRARIADTGEGPFLRTGDLGFLWEGELYLTSRIKDLIIVAGANHYPQDIEWTVESCHPAVRPGHVAATAVNIRGEERLLVAPEIERGALGDAVAREDMLSAIRRAISEQHEIQVHAVLILQRASLPKTASGKIQRHVCERFLRDMGPEVVAAWTADGGWIDRDETEPAAAAEAEQG